MPIYQRGDSWQVQYGSKDSRVRLTFKTKEEAEAALEQRQQAIRAAKAPAVALSNTRKAISTKTLADAYELTFKLKWGGSKSEKTCRINSGQVMQYLGADTPLSSLTTAAITEAIIEMEDAGNSGSTVNRKMSNLSTALEVAILQGWIDAKPRIPRRQEGKHRIRWMTEEEEARTLAKCHQLGLFDLADFIVVALDTGFRRGELLDFASRDLINGQLVLHAGSTKNDEARSVPATDRVMEVLKRRSSMLYPFRACLPIHILRRQWDLVKMHLGMEEDTQWIVHMLRHTCASRLVQRGVPLAVVQKWMGHKEIATTLRYAHLAPDNFNEALQKLQQKAA